MPSVVLLPGTATGWTNSTNAEVEDGVVATDTVTSPAFLKCSNYNAAGTISSTATITAIQARIKKSATSAGSLAAGIVDQSVLLFWSGGLLGQDQADSSTHWTIGTLVNSFYGGSNSTFGWTPITSIVLDSSFGVQIEPQDATGNGGTANIDVVELTLWYDTEIWFPQVQPNMPLFIKPEVVGYP